MASDTPRYVLSGFYGIRFVDYKDTDPSFIVQALSLQYRVVSHMVVHLYLCSEYMELMCSICLWGTGLGLSGNLEIPCELHLGA